MGKYENLLKTVLAIFGTSAWIAESIKTYPQNFIGVSLGNEYIRVHVLPSGRGLDLKSASGQVIIDVFTPAGDGPVRAALIADRLDAYLLGKSFAASTATVQFDKTSSFSPVGLDKGNAALFKSIFTIPFNLFGV
jgi:hypothetical protein